MWRWDSEPFGSDEANEDPDGDGVRLGYNLRFAGQYYDRETGLHYNYFRDYEPSSGGYVEPDPIGLIGGLDPYLYSVANPNSHYDRYGQRPGEAFTSADGAAVNMFEYILSQTSAGTYYDFLEYGNWIVKSGDCYTYGEPVRGTPFKIPSSLIPTRPENAVGFLHTHPVSGFWPDSPSAEFSDDDLSDASQSYYGSQWMGTTIRQTNGTKMPVLFGNDGHSKQGRAVGLGGSKQCGCGK